MKEKVIDYAKLAAFVLALLFGASYIFAWTPPTALPPNNNVSAPVNVGPNLQSKPGTLQVDNLYSRGKLCSANSQDNCEGGGIDGVVLDGLNTTGPTIRSNGPIQVSNNSTSCDDLTNVGAIRYIDGNPGELSVCKRTGPATFAWTAIRDEQSGGGGSGPVVYQCPSHPEWCYGRFREWPLGCSGEISLSSICYRGDCGGGGAVACTPVGRLDSINP
jgi:hypothetical protein